MNPSHHSSSPAHCHSTEKKEGINRKLLKNRRTHQEAVRGAQDLIIAPPLNSTLPQGRRWEIS